MTNSATWWTVFGISGGLGLLINPSLIFFLIALGIALLLTEDRRLLFTRQAAWGISVFVIVASPICSEKSKTIGLHLNTSYNQSIQNMNISLSLLWFILNQIVVLGPITDQSGLAWSTYSARNEASVGTAHHLGDGRSAKTSHEYRYLGLAFLLFLIAMLAFHAKDYYVSPVYPILFAAGGIGACPDPEQLFWMAYHFHAALLVSSR